MESDRQETDWTAVAAALGTGWSASMPSEEERLWDRVYAYLSGPDDLRVRVTAPYDGDDINRYRISGQYDLLRARGRTDHAEEQYGALPAIHLSRGRSPQAIAAEITRRLLPAYCATVSATIARTYERRWYQSLVAKAAQGIITQVQAAGAAQVRSSAIQRSNGTTYEVIAPIQSVSSYPARVSCRFEVKPGYAAPFPQPTRVSLDRISDLSPNQAAHLLCALMTLPPAEGDPVMPPPGESVHRESVSAAAVNDATQGAGDRHQRGEEKQ